ncbi:MAG: S9 family peptidase [Thermoplasmatales archaeon]|nr:S9 family peptidase [Thermoplasmatales archaeon]
MVNKCSHTVDDFLSVKRASDVEISKDGSKVAFMVSGTFKNFKEEFVSEIMTQSIKDEKERTFSRQGWMNFSPKFSPSGNKLAYLSKKEEEYRLLIYDFLKESDQEIVVEGEANDLQWADDKSLIVLIKDKDSLKEEKRNGNDAYFFEEEPRFDSLWMYESGSGFRRITSGRQIWEFNVNKYLVAAITSSLPFEWSWYEAEVSLIDLKDGIVKKIYSKKDRQVAKPRLSPDNKKVTFLESLWSDRGVNSGDILSIDINSQKPKNLTEGGNESYSEVQWISENEFYTLSDCEGTFSLSLFLDGKRKVLWSKFGSVHKPWSPSFSISKDKAVISFESSRQPDEVILIDLKTKKEKILTSINKGLENCISYSSEKVEWKSKDGLEISGIFRTARKNAPLMVIVHGGPTGSSKDSYMDLATLFISKGYSVFLPNYRGSTGKGRKFAELNLGDMGGKDLDDILSGIDYLIRTRGIDRKKIFIIGGSYGGFMSAWAITQTNIFKGAVSLFGISDWISFHGVSNLPTWDRIHYNEDPYKFDRFIKFSPLRYVDNVKTPVLLAHGMEDPYVPVGQYYQFYRALKEKGKDVRLLLFPREGHGFKERKHQEQFYSEVFKWLEDRS